MRTDTLAELVSASAGIIAYHEDRSREAIEQLELALPRDQTAAANGIVSFYLGNAYQLDNQDARAATAFERAIGFYERRQAAGPLGPQDELAPLKSYLQRGRIASFAGDIDGALAWYQKGVGLRDDLLARAGGLERPSDVHATYARLYAQLADAYRARKTIPRTPTSGRSAPAKKRPPSARRRGPTTRAPSSSRAARWSSPATVSARWPQSTRRWPSIRGTRTRSSTPALSSTSRAGPISAEQSLERVLALRPDDVGARVSQNLRQVRAFLDGNEFRNRRISRRQRIDRTRSARSHQPRGASPTGRDGRVAQIERRSTLRRS